MVGISKACRRPAVHVLHVRRPSDRSPQALAVHGVFVKVHHSVELVEVRKKVESQMERKQAQHTQPEVAESSFFVHSSPERLPHNRTRPFAGGRRYLDVFIVEFFVFGMGRRFWRGRDDRVPRGSGQRHGKKVVQENGPAAGKRPVVHCLIRFGRRLSLGKNRFSVCFRSEPKRHVAYRFQRLGSNGSVPSGKLIRLAKSRRRLLSRQMDFVPNFVDRSVWEPLQGRRKSL
ncbi:hypothetical protein CLUG_02068 [Clavispora lusitaniae ATCC 42720]|uniref:Uncharacterized protein n=1 Tax=Clavispora lusitaniae (strain ATCC 42720) TaxID=306902 RepID=C4Y1I6_CLAL4|nr:uncharacterized protein CLUG_02068 [Clavispora lusitaniae ATCC 42720]EEQ37945.1 hypothetical protein CLUG_02068 [Clavispora lusitaniae ATCC 42720]